MKILIIHRDVGTGSVGKIVEDLYYGIKRVEMIAKSHMDI